MEQPNDAETVEAAGGATTDRQLLPQNIVMNLSDDEKYIQYNISGNIFEVTAKYKPPIMVIGRGAYGIVCSVMNSETNEKVAIKKIMRACRNQISAKRTLREIKLLRHLEHENIVGIKDIILPYERDAFEDVYIAYELMDTDLEKIIKSNQKLNEQQHLYVMYYFLRGLKYIHSANVLHRDLKPNNLLLNANGGLKICDFGLARVASEARPMTANVTAAWYRAPELLLGSSAYTSAIDVWSAACIFLELMTRTPLFPGKGLNNQLLLILKLIGSPTEDDMESLNESAKQRLRRLNHFDRQSFFVKFPNVPSLAIELVEKMLQFDPRKRISAEDALAHPYFKVGVNDEPVCTKLFDFDFEEHPQSVEQIRELIYLEALDFNPGLAPVEEEQ